MTGNQQGLRGRIRRRLPRFATAAAVALSFLAFGAPNARAYTDPYDTRLTLVNGWTDATYGTLNAGVKQSADGIVTFTGAISGGTTGVAFTLPANDWPSADVYVPVDLCNAHKGRLFIQPNGVVTVQAENNFSDAQCFTSLDGVSFALPTSSTTLTLQNGWTGAPYGTGTPGVQLESSYWYNYGYSTSVHLTGAIANGTSSVAFTLPAGYRPSTTMYIPVDMCGATNGRLIISPTGSVSVQAENGTFSNATCFTSLDGARFELSTSPIHTSLVLRNSWAAYGGGTAAPAINEIDGSTFEFTGAMYTSGTNPVAFTLPSGFTPQAATYVNVDLCNATKGRLYIQTNGVVTVQAENGTFSNASCFTSLDGATFSLWLNPPA